MVGLKPKREEMIRSSAADLLGKDSVSVRKVARFLGRVQSAIGILPLARARSRAVGFAFSAVCKSKEDYFKFFKLSKLAIEELQMWAELASGLTQPINTNGMSTVSVDTDATETGYGWLWNHEIFSDKIPEQWLGNHINFLELWAFREFLYTAGAGLNATVLCWRVDNNTALAAIKNEGSNKSWQLTCLAKDVLEEAFRRSVFIQPIRVTSEQNLYADAGSRGKKVEDWSLSPNIYQRLISIFGKPDIDLMASEMSRKEPFFFSWNRADKEALALDALAPDISWATWQFPYLFPPFPLIPLCLNKIQEQRVENVLAILPYWPGKPWFSVFQELVVTVRRLPPYKNLVTDMITGESPPNIVSCRLIACILSGNKKKGGNSVSSLVEQESSLRQAGGPAQRHNILQVGENGWPGLVCMEYGRLRLL